jgi:hypothetical protein
MKRQPPEGWNDKRTGFRPGAEPLHENEGDYCEQQRRQENTEQEDPLLDNLAELFPQDDKDFVHTRACSFFMV